MRKLLAIIKHEYRKIVLKWSFLIGTLLFPFLMAGFAVVPAVIMSLKGEATRIVIVDPSGKIAPRIKENLSSEKIEAKAEKAARDSIKDLNATQEEKMKRGAEQMAEGFAFVQYSADDKSQEQIRRELLDMVADNEIDAYLIVPKNFESPDAVFEFRSRKAGDFVSSGSFRDAVNDAVRSQRLADASISETKLHELSQAVNFDEKGLDERGEEKDSEGTFVAAFIIGLMIYITLAIYGQAIMSAVVEEKETRIAEILFSSTSPFILMSGKLIGVGLA
jgi:ABC-2 type transport system permease protein